MTISGTGEAGATITVVAEVGDNATVLSTTVVGSDGAWTVAGIDVGGLPDGTVTFTAVAADAAGNTAQTTTSATKDTIDPAVAVTSVTDPVTIANLHTTEASGSGEIGASISLVVTDGTNSTSEYTTTVGEDGTWSIAGIDVSSLVDGTITFTVTASDAAGNTAQSSLTSTKTTVAIVAVTDPINAENAANVTVSGTGEVGATITLVATNGDNSTDEYTTVIGEDGTWSITGVDVSGLADGTITFTATATDTAGNTAESSLTATKDTVAPQIAISTVTDPINAETVASVSITGTGEAGASISVVATDDVDNSTIEYTTIVGEDGTWSIAGIDVGGLADGTITFTVTATDAAGNPAEATIMSLKDTMPPTVTLDTITSPVTIANHRNTSVGGTGEVGATITVVASDGEASTIEYTTTIGEDGTWLIDGIDLSTLADGTITFTITATDAAGNLAQASTTVTKTTVAVSSALDPINAENAANATIGGTGEVGADHYCRSQRRRSIHDRVHHDDR